MAYMPPSSKRRYCSRTCAGLAKRGIPHDYAPPADSCLGIVGIRPDLGHYVRSRWEANYARYLLSIGATYQYEPHRFTITLPDGSQHCYTPDFLVNGAYYVEVKGWMRADRRQAEVIQAARNQLPLPLMLVWKHEYRTIEQMYASGIAGWEYNGDPPPEKPKRSCPTCGGAVTSYHRRSVYCSRACFGASTRLPKSTKQCVTCGKAFNVSPHNSGQTFCSKPCWYATKRGRALTHTPKGGRLPEASRLKMIATKLAKRKA